MAHVLEVPLPEDEHFSTRQQLLSGLGLALPPRVRLSTPGAVQTLLSAARVASLSDKEMYYAPAGGWAPAVAEGVVSPRNEIAAAALLLELLAAAQAPGDVLAEARAACDAALMEPTAGEGGAALEDGGSGAAVCAWARREGAQVRVAPAQLPHGRGAVAEEDIPAGSDALTIPANLLFTAQVALEAPGERGEAYRMFAGLGEDALATLWLVAERADADSAWAPMLASLPTQPLTPLSWPPEAVEVLLAGTPLQGEATAALEQLAQSYGALFPALSEAMPKVFPAELYTLEAFRWATEVWGAYGITFQAEEGGHTATCLAPAAFLCNHGTHPHIVRYSRLQGGVLHLPVARSIPAGSEVLLSYGPKQNAELLLFYGFALPDNPYDEFPISFEMPEGESPEASAMRAAALQGCGLGLDHAVRRGPLASSMVAALRLLTADAESLTAFSGDAREGPLSARAEAAAAEALCGTLQALLEMAVQGDEAARAADDCGAWELPKGAREAAATYRAGNKAVLVSGLSEAKAWRAKCSQQ